MWVMKIFVCLLILFTLESNTKAQQYLNLDFEKNISPNEEFSWSKFGQGYEVKVDSTVAYTGSKSMMIKKVSAGQFGAASINFPVNDAKGKHLRYTGYIKTEGITEGYAGLWWRVDGKIQGQVLGFDNMVGRGATGSQNWKQYSIEMNIDTTAQYIVFGVIMPGNGEAWFDNLQIELDGKIYEQKQKEFLGQNDHEFDNGSNIILDNTNKEIVDNLTLLGKLWGYLKYYHPNIVRGNYNWDYELFRIMPKIISCKSKKEINKLISEWIKNLGDINELENHQIVDSADVKIFPELTWITENSQFDETLIKQLDQIKNSKRSSELYYVGLFPLGNPNFKNEPSYEKISFSDVGYRLLTLYRYWNIIQYFYPYRYLIKNEWDNALLEFIPKFINVKNELDYKLTIQELIAKVRDTHANIWNDKTISKYFGLNYSPLEMKFIEDKAVVIDYYNDELGKKTNLRKGDIIISVDNKKVENIVNERLPITPASNYKTQLRFLSLYLLRSNKSKLKLEYQREEKIYEDSIDCYNPLAINIFKKYQSRDTCWKFISKDIGYIYPGTIKNSYLPMIMSELKNTKGIIIDLICYPSEFIVFSLGEYLMNKPTDFAKFTKSEIKLPGLFTYTSNVKVGKQNQNYYKGKVVIIVDESTLSQAEYTAMAFRVAPQAIVIGSTTAAADGNVSSFYLPGGILTQISGLGVYYPDGKETQQIGIIPDIKIEPTIKGIKEGRDELLEKAIELINNDL